MKPACGRLFLDRRLSFVGITQVVARVLESPLLPVTVDSVAAAWAEPGEWGRRKAEELIAAKCS